MRISRNKRTFAAIFIERVCLMIDRTLANVIRSEFGRNKVIVILGPRQVGKTTLFSQIGLKGDNILRLDCDNYDDQMKLERKTSTELRNLLHGVDALLIDEAQRVHNIGLTIKMLGDIKSGIPIVVTGSSALEMANDINEPATGRILEHRLYPLSLSEMAAENGLREEQRLLSDRMVYGLYPEVVTAPAFATQTLMDLTNSYLYKDILNYKGIQKPDMLRKLVVALALQVGSEVSYNELSNLLGIDKETVENYIDLLEKCFIVFKLDSYSRNLRNEIKKGKKIYFYDNGVRNAVIANFAPLKMRSDVGALWENLMISERKKRNDYCGNYAQLFFWRTQQQKEIDLLEWKDGRLDAYEFKWKECKKATVPKAFQDAYPESSFTVITPQNYEDFVE